MTAAPHDPRYLLSRGRTVFVLTGVVMAMFVTSMNHLMVIVSVPDIVDDLGGFDRFSWIFTGFFLASAVCIPIWGKLSDLYGRRRLLLLAISLFIAGVVLCGFAPSMDVLIAGRVLSGIGGGGVAPLGMAAAADLMSPRERGKWQVYLSSGVLAASLAGPALGGWISDVADWRWTFYVSVVLGSLALVVVWFGFRIRTERREHTLDWQGAALLAAGLIPGLLATTWGGRQHAWSSVAIVSLFAASAGALALFVWWERRVPEPILPLWLFRNRTVAAAQIAAFAIGSAHLTCQTYIPLLVQGALGKTATSSGAILTPFMLTMLLSGAVFGQVMSRTGRYRWLLFGGPLVACTGLFLLGTMDARPSQGEIVRNMVLVAVGLGCGGAFSLAAQNAVPHRVIGVVTASGHFGRMMAGAVTLSVLSAVLTSRLDLELERRLPSGALDDVSPDELVSGRYDLSPELAGGVREAFGAAIPTVFMVALPIAALAFGAAFLVERRELRRTLAEQPEPARAT